jgi:hypothetical protein
MRIKIIQVEEQSPLMAAKVSGGLTIDVRRHQEMERIE